MGGVCSRCCNLIRDRAGGLSPEERLYHRQEREERELLMEFGWDVDPCDLSNEFHARCEAMQGRHRDEENEIVARRQ